MSRDISKLNGVGFSTIEDIKVPVMMGMKPKYSDLVFELNNLIEEFKKAKTFAAEFNVFLTKLVTDNVGLRLSNDPKLFKKLQYDIWEFRTIYAGIQIRLLAFWDKTDNKETLVIATHGFVKKVDNVPGNEIKRAVRIKNKYFNNKLAKK